MITAQKVKELRERTGIGMAKCKQALEQASGDINLAIDNLRKAGMASAVKKEGREAKEGLISFAENDSRIALVEVNSETDFVAKNDKFKAFLNDMAHEVLETKPASLDAFLAQKYSKDASVTIDERRASIVQVLGENIVIKKLLLVEKKKDHSYGLYSHMQGKIVTCVEINGPQQEELAKDVAMHVAAEVPEYLNPEDVPADVLEHEKSIAKAQMKGKPDNIVEKILVGKMQNFFEQVCLNKQKFVKENKLSVEEYVEKQHKGLIVSKFVRWQIGS